MKLVPLGLSCLAILAHLALHNNGELAKYIQIKLIVSVLATIPLVMLPATTMLLHGSLSEAVKGKSGERRSPMTLQIVTMAGAMATVGVFGLWAAVSPNSETCGRS